MLYLFIFFLNGRFWNPRIPKPCRKAHPKEEKWKCYLAPFMYPHLKSTFIDLLKY